ncbi:hypothetical protein PIROE2DRAFT_60066 [Piromyces sp. E2]|nr:hypothetical protein PIROE2DRAFT_60066 [Piromyces sp. E2]|eukprot:OUM65418.1 hypothetical protein PIROE2DRAFT_60066 [Piromyces sp. E2]
MIDKTIPEMHITMEHTDWEEMRRKAQITYQHQKNDFEVNAQLLFIYNGWVISDSVKNKWVERKFGKVNGDVTNLIQCRDDGIRFDDNTAKTKCTNSNEKDPNKMDEFNKFVDEVNASKTKADLEKIMEVDNFIK